jgi:hypothetical protein
VLVQYDPKLRARMIELLLRVPPQSKSTPPGFYLQPINALAPERNVLAELLFKRTEQPCSANLRPMWPEPENALSRLMRPQVKRCIFVSYHHGGDRYYYDLSSKIFCEQLDVIHDNSPERAIDSDDPTYVQRRLRENHIGGSSCTFVLVRGKTWGRKHVDWEISDTLEKKHGLIGVQLPTAPILGLDSVRAPERLADNVRTSYALWIHWNELMQNPAALPDLIEQANAKSALLIKNSRTRRQRSAPLA